MITKYENLVFIVGLPRSGTTWLWSMLISHPDIVPFTLKDVTGVEVLNENGKYSTSETNVLESGYSDSEVIGMFNKKILDNPGKVIVEETPLHAKQAVRVGRLFPRATIIFVARDVRQVMASMRRATFADFPWGKNVASFISIASEVYDSLQKGINYGVDTWVVSYESMRKDIKEVFLLVLNKLAEKAKFGKEPWEIPQDLQNYNLVDIPDASRNRGKLHYSDILTTEESVELEGAFLNRFIEFREGQRISLDLIDNRL